MTADANIGGNATRTAFDALRVATDSRCSNCAMPVLQRLDFSGLAAVTLGRDPHLSQPNSGTEPVA
jgi:hypothetical protein